MSKDRKKTFSFDAAAVERIRLGDVKTFEMLFRHHYNALVQFAHRFVQDRQVAEDIVQDIFLHVWRNRRRLKSNHSIKSYLFTATKNKSLKYLRRTKVENQYQANQIQLHVEKGSPEDAVKQKELKTAIEQAIQALPKKCRIIFCMNRFDHLKYAEIAEIQGISIKTVEAQMTRALKFLKKQLEHFLPPNFFLF